MHYKGNSIFAPRFALIRQSFTVGPPLASGGLNFCLIFQVGDSPKFFSPMQYFADSPKFYAANVSRYTVPTLQAALAITICVYSCKHNSSWVASYIHACTNETHSIVNLQGLILTLAHLEPDLCPEVSWR